MTMMIVIVKSYLQEMASSSVTECFIVSQRLAACTDSRVRIKIYKNHEDSQSVPHCPPIKHEKTTSHLDLSATHLAQIRIGRGDADDDGMALGTVLGLRGLPRLRDEC